MARMATLIPIFALLFPFTGFSSPLTYDELDSDFDAPYLVGQGNLPSRLEMIQEIGRKYPNEDCYQACREKGLSEVACSLGSIGSLYVLTKRQVETQRERMFIWQVPNASLTLEPYIYMREMEAGIPCSESPYIKQFPTRSPRKGERNPPLDRQEVCESWVAYFRLAGSPGKNLDQRMTGAAKARLRKKVNEAQSRLWRAHTTSLLHSYWQHFHEYQRHSRTDTPEDEYKMWMGWNLVVGKLVPQINDSSCAQHSTFIMNQLMPNCIRGTFREDGSLCVPDNASSMRDRVNQFRLDKMQKLFSTTDFSQAIEVFEKTIKWEREKENLKLD